MLNFTEECFTETYISTHGVGFKIRNLEVDGKTVRLIIGSFKNVSNWLEDIDHYCNEKVYKVLVGNKADLQSKRAVDFVEAKNFADTHNIPLVEASAKASGNVEQLFATLASDLKHASENGHIKDDTPIITTNAGKDHITGTDSGYGDDLDTFMKSNRFVPDRGFAGTERNSKREGPVKFEQEEEDPFGLGQFLEEAKRGDNKRKADDSRSSREYDSTKSKKEVRIAERDQT